MSTSIAVTAFRRIAQPHRAGPPAAELRSKPTTVSSDAIDAPAGPQTQPGHFFGAVPTLSVARHAYRAAHVSNMIRLCWASTTGYWRLPRLGLRISMPSFSQWSISSFSINAPVTGGPERQLARSRPLACPWRVGAHRCHSEIAILHLA